MPFAFLYFLFYVVQSRTCIDLVKCCALVTWINCLTCHGNDHSMLKVKVIS